MNSYEVRINVTFAELEKQLAAINKQVNELGKNASLSDLVSQAEQLKNTLGDIGSKLNKELRKATEGINTQIKKASVLSDIGAGKPEIKARLAMAEPFKQASVAAEQLDSRLASISNSLNRVVTDAKLFGGAMNAASKTLSTVSIPRTIGAGIATAMTGLGTSIKNVGTKALSFFSVEAKKAEAATQAWTKSVQGNASILGMWWQHFGRIAIGFTIAYRAMNAFEALLRKTGETIKLAIQESGELATLQGKLAMFTVLASKGTIGFDRAYRQSGQVIQNLAQASIRSISSIQELGVAMDELAQAGVLVTPQLTKQFVSFVDFTSLISQTSGDNVRQIRSEINALMEGQTRANNTLIRTMKNFGILNDKMIADLRKMRGRAEAFELIIKAIHEVWTKFVDKAISSDPTLALAVWDKSIRRLMISTIMLVSNTRGQFNLFAATIKEHIDSWNKAFSGDLTKNIDVKRFAIMMLQINKALGFALSAFEGIVKGVASLATAFDNLDASVKRVIKIVLVWEGLMLLWKGVKLLWSALKTLNLGLVVAMTSLGPWATMLMATAAAVFILANAFSVWTGKMWETTIIGTAFGAMLEKIIKLWESMPAGLGWWLLGGAVVGGVATGTIGGAALGAAALGTFGAALELAYKKHKDTVSDLKTELLAEQDALKASIDNTWKIIARTADVKKLGPYIADVKAKSERLQEIKAELRSINASFVGDPTFITETFKRTIGSLEALFAELGPKFKPVLDKIKGMLGELIYPHIDLTQKKGEEDPFQTLNNKATESIEDIKKKLGSLSFNIYEQFIRAVNAGKVALADLFAAPAADELTAKMRELRDKLVLVKTGFAISREGTTDWYVFRSAITAINAELAELDMNLKGIAHMQQLAPAVAASNKLKEEYDSILSTLEDGSREQIMALMALRTKYAHAMEGIEFFPDDKKQVDALNTYTAIMEKLRDVTLDWKVGIRAGLREVAKPQVFEMFRDVVVNSFKSMEDAIVDFTKIGKKAFRDMAESILNDLLRIIVRMSIIQPLANLFTSTFFASTATTPKPTVAPFVPHASGGWLNEKIVGLGLSSGKIHTFGEKGPEYITPADQVGGGNVEVNVYNAPAGTRVEQSNFAGTKRIDVYIDEVVASKLAGGSKSSMALRRMYGLNPALAGR